MYYFANATDLVSLMTVIFTCPGYTISSWIFFAISLAAILIKQAIGLPLNEDEEAQEKEFLEGKR